MLSRVYTKLGGEIPKVEATTLPRGSNLLSPLPFTILLSDMNATASMAQLATSPLSAKVVALSGFAPFFVYSPFGRAG